MLRFFLRPRTIKTNIEFLKKKVRIKKNSFFPGIYVFFQNLNATGTNCHELVLYSISNVEFFFYYLLFHRLKRKFNRFHEIFILLNITDKYFWRSIFFIIKIFNSSWNRRETISSSFVDNHGSFRFRSNKTRASGRPPIIGCCAQTFHYGYFI